MHYVISMLANIKGQTLWNSGAFFPVASLTAVSCLSFELRWRNV